MKKLLFSFLVLGITSVLAIGATTAYFSDTEISAGNTFVAGTLDLKVDDKESATEVVHVVKSNLKPSEPWTTQLGQQWVVKNAGTIPGTVSFTIKNVRDYENGCSEPEIEAGDTTCGTESNQGELGTGLLTHIAWKLNQVPWGELMPSFNSLRDAENQKVSGTLFDLAPGESKNAYLQIYWDISTRDNLGQGDQVEFDVEFTLTQK